MHIQVRTQSILRLAFHALNLQKWFPLNLFRLQWYLEWSSANNFPSLYRISPQMRIQSKLKLLA